MRPRAVRVRERGSKTDVWWHRRPVRKAVAQDFLTKEERGRKSACGREFPALLGCVTSPLRQPLRRPHTTCGGSDLHSCLGVEVCQARLWSYCSSHHSGGVTEAIQNLTVSQEGPRRQQPWHPGVSVSGRGLRSQGS